MKNFCIKLLAQISMLSLLFCVVVGSFMLVDFLRFNSVEEPAKASLDKLRSDITASPDKKELKELFGELELIYRRAYFVNDKQSTQGAMLLLFGLSLFLLSFAGRAYFIKTLPKLPESDSLKRQDSAEDNFIKLLYTAIGVGAVLSVGVIFKDVFQAEEAEVESQAKNLYTSQADLDANWTSFRGSRNDGIARNFRLPENFKISQLWEADLDIEGFNSVVQFADTLYVCGLRDESRVVKAFSVDSGKALWENSLDKQVDMNFDDQTGPAPSTMSCDAYRAYAIFPSGEVVAYTKEGKLAWQKKFDMPEITYGYASSLLLVEDKLIVQMCLDETNIVYALDSASGKELWQCSNDVIAAAWATPTLVEFESKKIIIALSSVEVVAIDADSGAIIWKNKCLGGEVAPSATYLDGRLYVAIENMSALALDIKNGEVLWENSSLVLPSISSVAVDKNGFHLYSSGASVTRVNIENGEVLSEVESYEGFNSSPLIVGDKILACDLAGSIFITKSDEDLGEESVYEVEEQIDATPALIGDKIIIRLESKILCLKVEEAK